MRYAIDIALIPPKYIIDQIRFVNEASYNEGKSSVLLGHDDFVPHLSLLKGVSTKEHISVIEGNVEAIADKYLPLRFTISKHKGFSLIPQHSDQLMAMQQEIFEAVEPYLSHDATPNNFVREDIDAITEDCYPWINDVDSHFTKDTYKPHITIGEEASVKMSLPIVFENTEIALYQLGRYNTCRKLLWTNKNT